ncbi:MAG: RNA pyrophosphohydrolase [Pseudomonadota bacterium]
MPAKPTAYRPCVGVMVINRAGLVWMGRRVGAPDDAEGHGHWWQMPQGGIDDGEDPRSAALRELAEETGMRSADIIGETSEWLTYDLPDHLVGIAWGGRFRGQKQKWFAVRFLGSDEDINIDPPPGSGHDKEFETWEWVPAQDLVPRVVEFKRDVYVRVVAELSAFAKPL